MTTPNRQNDRSTDSISLCCVARKLSDTNPFKIMEDGLDNGDYVFNITERALRIDLGDPESVELACSQLIK